MLKPALMTAPADPPVSVAECKSHLNVTHSSHDTLIGIYLAAAVAHLDGYAGLLGRCMVSQGWRQDYHCWPMGGVLRLPFCDVSAIGSVKYSDESDVEQTVDPSFYAFSQDDLSSFLWFEDTFTAPALNTDRPDPIRVLFTAGYGAAAAVPGSLKAAILLMVGDFYDNREDTVVADVKVSSLPRGVDALIRPHRRAGF